MSLKGVYKTEKKDGTVYYRASFTYKGKHIALGSSQSESLAAQMYEEACRLCEGVGGIEDYKSSMALGFDKYVSIVNFRDNGIYLPNPIYVRKLYFSYYLEPFVEMRFSADDLFYYMNHRILKRGGHLYVNDYGSQISLGRRYGIKSYAREGKDYRFKNSDRLDYRYENLEIINTYHGVSLVKHNGKNLYRVKIHVRSDIVVGYYDDALEAAVAYNKAADILKSKGVGKNFMMNFVEEIGPKQYASLYTEIKVSKNIESFENICH